MGYKLLARLADDLAEVSVIEFAPKQDGRNMVMVLAPNRRKSDAVKAKASNLKKAAETKSAPNPIEKEEK